MNSKYSLIWLLFFFLSIEEQFESVCTNREAANEYSKGCDHLQCEIGSRCIKRRFWCKNPPCPGMLYCSKSRKESLKGPVTCDTVRCSRGYICVVKVRECRWDEKCKQQTARCVTEKEYYDVVASCSDFKCPLGKRCILRESYCIDPPCKLLRSCAETNDVQAWFERCKILQCLSEHECFLRKPSNNCLDQACGHTPDCFLTTDEPIIEHCRGWICPRAQKCVARIVGTCKGFNCTIERSCREFSSTASSILSTEPDKIDKVAEQSSTIKTLVQIETDLIRQDLERRKINVQTTTSYPTAKKTPIATTTSMSERNTSRVAFKKDETKEEPIFREQNITIRPTLITETLESSSNEIYPTMSFESRLSNNKGSTFDISNNKLESTNKDVFKIALKLLDSDSSVPSTLFTDEKVEPTASRETKKSEVLKEIYVASQDSLTYPMTLEGINIIEQTYPIWIKNELHPAIQLDAANERGDITRYYTSQKPYRILLPPYKPVILIEDTRNEQLPPLFTFNYRFNEAALMPLPEIISNGRDNDADISAKNEITNEKKDGIPKTKHTHTNDYISKNKKYYGIANYPYDAIFIPGFNTLIRESEQFGTDKSAGETLSDKEFRSSSPKTFYFGDIGTRGDEHATTSSFQEAPFNRAYTDRKHDDGEDDDSYNSEIYSGIDSVKFAVHRTVPF